MAAAGSNWLAFLLNPNKPAIEQPNDKQYIYQKFGIVLLFNMVLIVLSTLLLPFYFETNDDTAMLSIASGSPFDGVPDAHLIFINYLYGLILTALYTLLPTIEWYTILFILIHIIANSIISWKIVNHRTPLIRRIIYLLLFYIFEVRNLLNFQFTTTAAICALGGILLLISEKRYQQIIGVILFTLAFAIRFEAVIPVLAICSPLIIYKLLEQLKAKSFSFVFIVAAIIVFPIIIKAIDHNIYNNDPDWVTYQEYNSYRSSINDNPNAKKIKELPASVTESDYQLFLMFFPDPQVFDNKSVKEISSKLKKIEVSDKISNIPQNISPYRKFLIALLVVIILKLVVVNNKSRIILLSSVLISVLLMCFVSLDGTLKERVFIIFLISLSWILFTTEDTYGSKTKHIIKFIILIFFFYFSGRFTKLTIKDSYMRAKYNKSIASLQQSIFDSVDMKGQYIIDYYGSIKIEVFSPYKISEIYRNSKIMGLGWMTKIPFYNGKLDSYLDIIDKNAIYISKELLTDAFPNIKKSVKAHYNIDVRYEIIAQTEDFVLIKLISINE